MSRARSRATAADAPFAALQGTWRSHDYGTILRIGPDGYQLFEETRVSCLPTYEGSLADLSEIYVDLEISPQRRAFSARRAAGVTRMRYRRLQCMPANCADCPPAERSDPVWNFEVLWHTFAERYALFEHRGVDWQAAYDVHRPTVDTSTSARRLFDTCVAMLRPLRDGHVELRSERQRFNAGDTASVLERLAAELRRAGSDRDPVDLLIERRERARAIIHERYLRSSARHSCNGLLEWGQLSERAGYLAIHAMAGESACREHPREDQEAVAAAMGPIMRDIGQLPIMAIDLRGNGGGYDGVALRAAGYFTDRKRHAFSKAASRHEGFGGKQTVTIEARGERRYHGRIFLLTSGLTASAAEIFVLALLQHPRITRIGEATHGILSDAMERHLPNGWRVSLSNELYRAFDGSLYEDRGVPPHIALPFLDRRDIEQGRDVMLDQVLSEQKGDRQIL